MIIIPDERIRKYVSYENGKWVHDPNMPKELLDVFDKFISDYFTKGTVATVLVEESINEDRIRKG